LMLPAVTATLPALPVPPVPENRPVGGKPRAGPPIDSGPATASDMSPPFPAPNVALRITPPLTRLMLPAFAVTLPAFPGDDGPPRLPAMMPVVTGGPAEPSIVTAPVVCTDTIPAFPEEKLAARI